MSVEKNRKYLLILSEALLVFVFMSVKHFCITKVIKKRASGKQCLLYGTKMLKKIVESAT